MSGTELLTNVAGALSQRFAPKLARQFNRLTVLGSVIPTEPGFGKNVGWDVEVSGAVASSYAEGADLVSGDYNVDPIVPATLSWGHYKSAFAMSETEVNAAASSAGSADAILKLVGERIMSNGAKLASVINVDLWSGTGSDTNSNPNIVGLQGGAAETTGIYANINRSSYTEWKGNVLSNGGIARALTIDLLDQLESNIYTASGVKPNIIVCDPNVFRKYKGLFESLRRIDGTGPLVYNTSTSELFYQGIPILRDKDAPSGTLQMFNTEYVKKVYLPNAQQANEDVYKATEFEGTGSNGDGNETGMGLPFRIVPIAKTGDSLKFMVKAVLNLKVTRPNTVGYVKDIQTS
jgi:hypothetical protein